MYTLNACSAAAFLVRVFACTWNVASPKAQQILGSFISLPHGWSMSADTEHKAPSSLHVQPTA